MNKNNVRISLVVRYLADESVSEISRSLKHSRKWSYYWLNRYNKDGIEALTNNRNRTPYNKTLLETEQLIIRERIILQKRKYSLIGAPSIQKELIALGVNCIPSVRTIEAILERNGFTVKSKKRKTKGRLKSIPRPLAKQCNDIFEFDLIGPKYLKDSRQKYYYYNIKDSFSKVIFTDAYESKKSLNIEQFLIQAFQNLGIPKILQMDNALEFRGSNRHPRGFSRVIRLCLMLGIEVMFIPEGMPQFNGSIENFNGFSSRRFIKIQSLKSLKHIKCELEKFQRIANSRYPHESLEFSTSDQAREVCNINKLSKDFKKQSGKIPLYPGKISFIRLVRRSGRITILNEKFLVGKRKKY